MKTQQQRRKSTYNTWFGMKQRCLDPKAKYFGHYGGRGIKVCERWMTFENFVADMGLRPDNLSLDRIDNDGDYEPSNCRWATKAEQMSNRRCVRMIVLEGKQYKAHELAKLSGMKTDTILTRAASCSTLDELLDPKRRIFHKGLALGGIANGKRIKERTHCVRGHEFTPENTCISKQGWRRCRHCARDKMRRITARRAAERRLLKQVS
jgi:hypothetical protein